MQQSVGSAARRLAYAMGWMASALLAACGGGGGNGPLPQGTLKMSMTDAPSCYRKVEVTVEKVRVHKGSNVGDGQAGWEEIVPPNGPVKIDLLALTNGALADLGSAQVDIGTYRDMRLVLADEPGANTVTLLNGTQHELKTPSGQTSGIKLRTSIDVAEGATTDIVLDFDACKSVVLAGNSGQYILKPVIRLSDKVPGGIQGYVDMDMVEATDITAVTAYLDGEAVRSTTPDSNGKFKLAYLQPGTYTVVITSTGKATGVITEVPVGSTVRTVASSGSRIDLPASATHTVLGSVQDGSAAVGDAFVTAWQAITGGAINVLSTAVDYDTGEYTLKLPVEDPVVAPYSGSGLTFTADTTAGGEYTLKASAPGRATLSRDVDTDPPTANPVDFTY